MCVFRTSRPINVIGVWFGGGRVVEGRPIPLLRLPTAAARGE